MKEIEQKAKSGKPKLRGLTEGDMASFFDDLALTPSRTYKTTDLKQEKEITSEVIIGEGRDVRYPLLLDYPIFFDANPMASVNKSVRIALVYGASISKTPINIGEGMLAEEKSIAKKFEGNLIMQWSPLRIGVDTKAISRGRAMVITLFGANQFIAFSSNGLLEKIQGKNGLLSGEVLGPKKHSDMESAEDLNKHVELLREASGYDIPVIVKIPSSNVYENTKSALAANPDAVIVDAAMNPFSTLSSVNGTMGETLIGSIPSALKAFKENEAKKKGIKFLVSGGFRNSADIVKALALGASACGIVESATIALGCDLCGECFSGKCKKGIATKEAQLKSSFNWKVAGKKLSNYVKATKKEIEFLLDYVGVNDIKDLNTNHIRALTYDAAAITGAKLIGYDRELPMWFH